MPNCLKKYRRIRGLNQMQVAAILELKGSSIVSRWESGKALPNTLNLLKLSVLYRTLIDGFYIDQVRELRKEVVDNEKKVIL